MEGAVVRHLVGVNTSNVVELGSPVHYVKLARDLNKMAFTQPEIRAYKQAINALAKVMKNDPHLSIAAGNIPLPRYAHVLSDNFVTKAKMTFIDTAIDAVNARIPWSANSRKMALVNLLADVLDNPLGAQSIDKLTKSLPDDPQLKVAIHKLAIEYAKTGQRENYGKIPLYSVSRGKQKVSQTNLGKGLTYFTNKKQAKKLASSVDGEVGTMSQELVLHTRLATLNDVKALLGEEITWKEASLPKIQEKLIAKGYVGVADGERVLIYK